MAWEEQWVQGMVSGGLTADHVFEYISRTRAAVCVRREAEEGSWKAAAETDYG